MRLPVLLFDRRQFALTGLMQGAGLFHGSLQVRSVRVVVRKQILHPLSLCVHRFQFVEEFLLARLQDSLSLGADREVALEFADAGLQAVALRGRGGLRLAVLFQLRRDVVQLPLAGLERDAACVNSACAWSCPARATVRASCERCHWCS